MAKGNNYTKIADLVTGSEGSAYITIDGENRYFLSWQRLKQASSLLLSPKSC